MSFGLNNHLSFGVRFPTLITFSKMGSLDMSRNQNGISVRFSSRNSSQKNFYSIGSLFSFSFSLAEEVSIQLNSLVGVSSSNCLNWNLNFQT